MKINKAIIIVILFILLSAGNGCLLTETKPPANPVLPSPAQPTPLPPTEYSPRDIEIHADNLTPVMDKGSSVTLNITIIANYVRGGTSVSFDHEIYAIYPNGSGRSNPPEVNLSIEPQQIVFPKTVNSTEPPYKLYSSLTVKSASDANYFITIRIIGEKVKILTNPINIDLKVGRGGYFPPRYNLPGEITSTGNVTRSISPSKIQPGGSLNITLTPSPATLFKSYKVIETIPDGFTFVKASTSYTPQGNAYAFNQTGSTPITYTLIASSIEGDYTLFGIFKDASANTGIVSGDGRISVSTSIA